jgi:alpha-L-arabinofuranosidase
MFSDNYLPNLVRCQVVAARDTLDVNAKRSVDGRTLALQVVNPTDKAIPTQIQIAGFSPNRPVAQVTELSGPLALRNSADHPNTIVPHQRQWQHGLKNGDANYTFAPYSVSMVLFE